VLREKLERWTRAEATATSAAGSNTSNGPAQHIRTGVIDQAQIAVLKAIQPPGDADFFSELIDLFLDETESHLKVLHAAGLRNDATEIRQVAHLLKGSSANIGASQMAALCLELELKNKANGDTGSLLAKLDQEFELVRAALDDERKEADK
jgi:HPt (histidine-containing phosphotransfer) domain-containing protein